jgi:hypothetical protein
VVNTLNADAILLDWLLTLASSVNSGRIKRITVGQEVLLARVDAEYVELLHRKPTGAAGECESVFVKMVEHSRGTCLCTNLVVVR